MINGFERKLNADFCKRMATCLILSVLALIQIACGSAETSKLNNPEKSTAVESSITNKISQFKSSFLELDRSSGKDPSTLNMAPIQSITVPENSAIELEAPVGIQRISFYHQQVVAWSENKPVAAIQVLIADTIERRKRGLMYQKELPENVGMLFTFPNLVQDAFWAKETPMDLDIAFLDAKGTIIEIHELTAFSTDRIEPENEYLHAIELPRGWFAKKRIYKDDRFEIPGTPIEFVR